MPRHCLNPISSSRRKRLAEYRRQTKAWWAFRQNQSCRRCRCRLTKFNRTIHHSHGRVGSLLTYRDWWIPLCIPCHDWVHGHPKEARAAGLLCELGGWNVPFERCRTP